MWQHHKTLTLRLTHQLKPHVCVCTNLFHLGHDVFRVVEWPNLLEAVAIDDGHSLEAHGLHGGFGGQQEAMVEVIEELLPAGGKK